MSTADSGTENHQNHSTIYFNKDRKKPSPEMNLKHHSNYKVKYNPKTFVILHFILIKMMLTTNIQEV